jgi:hypothetical protein
MTPIKQYSAKLKIFKIQDFPLPQKNLITSQAGGWEVLLKNQ